MITQIATLIMLLYAVGVGFLSRTLHKHLPPISQKYISRWLRPWLAIFWMWGPTFWFVPGLVWFRVLGIPQQMRYVVIGLSLFWPLFIFVVFTSLLKLFPYRNENPFDMLLTYLTVGAVTLTSAAFLLLLFLSPVLTIWQSLFLGIVISLHPCISVIIFVFITPRVIPSPSSHLFKRLRDSLMLVTSFFTNFPKPVWVVQDGKMETRVDGNPVYGSGQGCLLTEPENVVILGNGYQLTRIEDPGVAITADSESPYRLVDLRNQKRAMNVVAITRDGIEINVPISFSFRIDSGPRRPELHRAWPIHKRDVYQAVFAEVVDPNGKTPLDDHMTHPWEELPLKIAAYKVKQAVAFYSLVQLYEHGNAPEMHVIHQRAAEALAVSLPDITQYQLTREVISKLVLDSVQQLLKSHGFHIYAGGVVGSIVPLSKELTKQRVEAWKTRWISKVMHWQAETQTQLNDELTEVGVGVALDLIDGVIDETAQTILADNHDSSKQATAAILLSNLLELARMPEVTQLLPDSVLPTLAQLQRDAEGS